MKLYLIKRQHLDLGNIVQVNDKTFNQNSQKLALEFSASGNSTFQRDICTKLSKKVAEIVSTNSELKSRHTDSTAENEGQYADRENGDAGLSQPEVRAGRLEEINSLLSLSTNEMEIKATSDFEVAYCEDSVAVPEVVWNCWVKSGHVVSGNFSLELFVNSFAEPTIEQLQTDFSILASNGNYVNCHKALLLGHNIEAFQSMLSNQYNEGKTGKLEMRDMSEEGVRALLAYLYYSSLEEPSRKCDIAFELLKAADKYGICTLTTGMIDIFLEKRNEWFSVDVALALFQIANVFDNDRHGEDLRRRAVKVLKINSPRLTESEELKALLKEDPASGIQLMQYFCDTDNNKK